MHRTKRKAYCRLLAVMFIFSMVLSPIVVAPVSAVTIDDAVTQINDIYQYLDANNKDAMQAARDNLKTEITQIEWEGDQTTTPATAGILTPFLTPEAIAKYSGNETALKNDLKKVLTDVGDLYYSTNPADLKTNITTYKEANSVTFKILFGTEIGFDDLYQLIMDMRTELPNVITVEQAGLLANDTNAELEDKMPGYFKAALALATDKTKYLNNDVFNGKLTAIGWSTNMLVDAKTALAAQIDPSKDAELAVALAAIRYKTALGTDPLTVSNSVTAFTPYANTDAKAFDASGRRIAGVVSNTLAPGTLNFQVKIMDKNLDANYVNWASSDANVVEVTEEDNGNPILTAKNTGTACITVYRYINGGTTTPENDWLLKFDVTVEGGQQILYGDVNGDGNISAQDITLLRRVVAQVPGYQETVVGAGDCNRDGNVTAQDITLIRRVVAQVLGYQINQD